MVIIISKCDKEEMKSLREDEVERIDSYVWIM